MVSPSRLFHLYQHAINSNRLEGSFAQVGVCRGGSAKLIAEVKKGDKKFLLFDTFEGLPECDPDLDRKGRFGETSKQEVEALFSARNDIEICCGRFPETLTEAHQLDKYCFVYLDVDIYHSNLNALEFFYPRMYTGGVILIDDYNWTNTPGITQSTDEFLERQCLPTPPVITTRYQAAIFK